MKCLEVRVTSEGFKRRRYRLADGRRLTTFEIPDTVLANVGRTRLAQAMSQFMRGEASRARRARIEALLNEGWKPTAIAHECGCTEARVRQIRAQLTKEK